MEILVDTSVWSLGLRRSPGRLNPTERALERELRELVTEGRVRLIGAVRQELLSGIREALQFERLKEKLRGYPDQFVRAVDHEFAAELCNQCRSAGIAGSPTDFLLCAVSIQRGWPLFTTDRDFASYLRVVSLRLYKPRTV